jgi:ABC-type transport system involved in multi-copper enzyme maturation permease subunit
VSLYPPRYSLPPPSLGPRSSRVWAVISATIRERAGGMNIALLVLTFIVVLLFIVVPFYLASLAPGLVSGPPLSLFYLPFGSQLWFFFEVLLTTSVAAGVVAGDVANKSIFMYLSRPITALDYLTAKSVSVGFWLLLGVVLPGIVGTVLVLALGYIPLFVALQAAGTFVGLGLLTVIVFTSIGVLISALSPKTTYAGAAIFGLLVGAEVVVSAVRAITHQTGALYFSVEEDLLAIARAALGVNGFAIDAVWAGVALAMLSILALLLAYWRVAHLNVVAE